MKEPPNHPLSEAVTGLISKIISMSLGLLRARGWRGLLELPMHFRLALELRRMAKEFVALFEAFQAGTLPPVAPAADPQPIEPPCALPPRTATTYRCPPRSRNPSSAPHGRTLARARRKSRR